MLIYRGIVTEDAETISVQVNKPHNLVEYSRPELEAILDNIKAFKILFGKSTQKELALTRIVVNNCYIATITLTVKRFKMKLAVSKDLMDLEHGDLIIQQIEVLNTLEKQVKREIERGENLLIVTEEELCLLEPYFNK